VLRLCLDILSPYSGSCGARWAFTPGECRLGNDVRLRKAQKGFQNQGLASATHASVGFRPAILVEYGADVTRRVALLHNTRASGFWESGASSGNVEWCMKVVNVQDLPSNFV
jgi:hypothetical protein